MGSGGPDARRLAPAGARARPFEAPIPGLLTCMLSFRHWTGTRRDRAGACRRRPLGPGRPARRRRPERQQA